MLNKKYRISKKKDYNNIYQTGRNYPGKYMILLLANSEKENNRYGIIASKKIGNAVKRNKAKRRIRSIINNHKEKLKNNYDLVIIARPAINNASYTLINNEFLRIMRKAGLL
jgi:ribonuclease P protein component